MPHRSAAAKFNIYNTIILAAILFIHFGLMSIGRIDGNLLTEFQSGSEKVSPYVLHRNAQKVPRRRFDFTSIARRAVTEGRKENISSTKRGIVGNEKVLLARTLAVPCTIYRRIRTSPVHKLAGKLLLSHALIK